MIAVEEFLDYGEDIFGRYPDFTFLSAHIFSFRLFLYNNHAKKMPRQGRDIL